MQTSPALPEQLSTEQLLVRWVGSDPDALAFVQQLLVIASTWDDLIDQDVAVPDASVHALVESALSLHMNPFYAKFSPVLQPVLFNAVRNWKAANVLERSEAPSTLALHNAFILRASYVDVIAFVAALLKGQEWGITVTVEVRLHCSREGFVTYCQTLTKEQEARNGCMRRD